MKSPASATVDFHDPTIGEETPTPAATSRPAGSIVANLFRSHASRLRRLLRFRLHDQEDAQEAAQDVFLKLWRYESRGELRDDSRAYMYAASQSAVADTARWRTAHARDQMAEVESNSIPDGGAALEDRIHWRHAMGHFVEGLRQLPELTGNVFLLYYVDDLTRPQIARALGISERTVDRHLVKAMGALRHQMKDYL